MTVPFGKYRGLSIETLLRDHDYCHWLLGQAWFDEGHPKLAARVLEHHPPARWSLLYHLGWRLAVDAVWGDIRKVTAPDEYWTIDRRVRGCTCQLRVECGDGGELLHEEHEDGCPYCTLQQERPPREHRERHACKGTRTDGQPCRAIPAHGQEYCRHHRDQQVPEDAGEVIAVDFQRYLKEQQ